MLACFIMFYSSLKKENFIKKTDLNLVKSI
uniref:Uncharacterized protein n=1 Tax=Anguilla anguilla TaxID=7936 RepID=A0A0E9XRM2_ANGAN